VLLYNNVPDAASNCTLTVLAELARTHALPLVDASALLAAKRDALEAEMEREKDLVPPPPQPRANPRDATTIVFRVDMGKQPGTPHIMGNLQSLGAFRPNQVALFDDGTHGDQRAGDRVWSLAVELHAVGRIAYLYTNGEVPGSWTGLESYQPRVFAVTPDAGSVVYPPLAEFGRMLLRSDPVHPDAIGAGLIAEALAQAVRARPGWQAYVAAHAVSEAPAPFLPTTRPRAQLPGSRSG